MLDNSSTENKPLCDIGFIGLGVMGKSLALNLADNGYRLACFDLDNAKIEELVAQDIQEAGKDSQRIIPCYSFDELIANVIKPSFFMVSVPAGVAVDAVCEQLIASGMSKEDILIDTGNSLWTDSVERQSRFSGKCFFFTTAVSGGEAGARFGPSLMPSGDKVAWPRIEPVLNAISAKVDPNTGKPIESFKPGHPIKEGEPCNTYIGPIGAGHYVKMVHNGIEYADMQLICETYHIMREALAMSPEEIARVFRQWNNGPLNSYLIEISAEVLEQSDPYSDKPLIDVIVDKAGQKGTGLWTAVSALQIGSPAQTIASAVFARSLSSLKNERLIASEKLASPDRVEISDEEKQIFVKQLEKALYCSKICSYAQGFQLMKTAAAEQGWKLQLGEIAKIWRAGCIIRAVFLQSITSAYEKDADLANLLLDPYFSQQIKEHQSDWRQCIAKAVVAGIPVPAMSSALSYYDSYKTSVLPANLLQGQRDFFGAHTFERNDRSQGEKFHIKWNDSSRPMVRVK